MRTRFWTQLILAPLLTAQSTVQPQSQLRVTVNLVHVDAIVTDAKGNTVPDLTGADFRVLVDGKAQPLKYAEYTTLRELPASAWKKESPSAARPAMPIETPARDKVRRTIVIFVADLLTSSESMPRIRSGLRTFIQNQVQPGDLVAIVRSTAGLGALQDFTSDTSVLLSTIDQVNWTSHAKGNGAASAYIPITTNPGPAIAPGLDRLSTINSIERPTLATTASLLKVVRTMTTLPGRKSIVIVSDGLRLTSPDELDPGTNQQAIGTGAFIGAIHQGMRRIVDESVRAGVAIYAIDTRGSASLRTTAADHVTLSSSGSTGGDWVSEQSKTRRDDYYDNQAGTSLLSSETGGFMIFESNRIDASLVRVMEDQQGYYALGFQPSPEAMQPDRLGQPIYHKLKIEVTRPGLRIRSHAGFFGIADPARPTIRRAELELSHSTAIPVEIEATTLRVKNDDFIRATIYVDGKDLAFSGPPNHRIGLAHLILRVFNAKGDAIDGGIDQMHRVDLDQQGDQRVSQFGLTYSTLLPVKKPGPYVVRAMLRDETTGKTGSTSELVTIPNAKEKGVRLSGIVFQHALGSDGKLDLAARPHTYSPGQTVPFAVQIISVGTWLKPETLALRVRLFRDGDEAWHSVLSAIDAGSLSLMKGSIDVPKGVKPGKYLVRVDLSDKTQPETAIAWQWAKLTLVE